MRKLNFLFTTVFLFASLSSFCLIRKNNLFVVQAAEQRYECFPFLPTIQTSGQYQVIGGNGEITQSNYPKVLPSGLRKDLRISSGGYNPTKKQITLVVKNRYISIFLKEPLAENKPVEFIARPCGSVVDGAPRINKFITPELFFESGVFDIPCSFPQSQTIVCFSFKGKLTKKGNKIQGTFAAQAGFYLTDNHDFPGFQNYKPYKGLAEGKFSLSLQPGRSNNFPNPTNPIRGLW